MPTQDNLSRIFNNVFQFSDSETLFNLRLVNLFLNKLATFALFKRQYHYHGAVNTDKLFKMALNQRNQELTADIIDESFNKPLRYANQKEKFLLGYAIQFVDEKYQGKLDEIKLDDLIDNIRGYYPLQALHKLIALLPQINQEQLLRILNLALAKGIFFITKKEFNEFKILLAMFLNHLTHDNREPFFKNWQQKDISNQMRALLHDLENTNADIELPLVEKKSSTIEELFVKLQTKRNPFKYLSKLKQRVSELTQEQLLDFVKSDVPYMELADQRTYLLTMLADFAKHLDPEHQEYMRNYVRELLRNKNEQCFTIARMIAPYLTEDDVGALIDFAGNKLLRRYEYKKDEDWSAYRFIDFSYTLDLLKNKIPASKSLALLNMFKAMIENNGFVEYCMNAGLRQSVRQLSQYFNKESLPFFVNFVEQYLKLPQQDDSSLNIIIQVLIDVIPSRLTDEQFAKLFTFQGEILFKLHFGFLDEITQTYLDALALRLSSEQAATVKQIMTNIFNYKLNEILSAAQQSVVEDDKEKLMITDGQEEAKKIEIRLDKKAAENICHYVLMLGKVACYFDHQEVKQYLQVASQFYQFMTDKQIEAFFHLIPKLYRHADEGDRHTLYHFMSKFDEKKYLYSSFDVVEKICNKLPYDLLQHYLQRLMAVEAPYKEAHVPCHDTIPVLFKMIPLLNSEDSLKLLDYLVKQAHTQDDFDLSDLIFQMLKHSKCNMDDLAKTDILSLKWGAKMIKIANLYQKVAPTNCHFTLFKKQQIPMPLLVGAESYKRDIEEDMSPPTCSLM